MRLIDADRLKTKITGITKPHEFVEEIDKRPTVEAIPIDKPFLKMKYKGYTVYKTEWLKEHIDMEYHVIKGDSETKAEAIPIEWMKSWAMKNWVKTKRCEFDIIVSKLIDDWLEAENG